MSKYWPARPRSRVGWALALLFVLGVATGVGLLKEAVFRARLAAQSMTSL